MTAVTTAIDSAIMALTAFNSYLEELLEAAKSAEEVIAFLNDHLDLRLDLNGLHEKLEVFVKIVGFVKNLATVLLFAFKTAKIVVSVVRFFLGFWQSEWRQRG